MRIFISYRRDDSASAARRVHDHVVAEYGRHRVFMDVDDIGYGDDFVRAIDAEMGRCGPG